MQSVLKFLNEKIKRIFRKCGEIMAKEKVPPIQKPIFVLYNNGADGKPRA